MSELKGQVSHHEREIAELHADRELAVACLAEAMATLDKPGERSGAVTMLRTLAQARKDDLAEIAELADISRASLDRALVLASPQ
jgi:DNA-binding phage protein